MVIKRGMNKKGESADPGSNVGGLIIVGLVVIIIAVAIYLVYTNTSTTVARLSPDELTALKTRCIAYSQIGTPIGEGDFCSFKTQTFGGKEGVASCQQSDVYDSLKDDKDYGTLVKAAADKCGDKNAKAKEYCNKLTDKNQFKNLLVNGFSCASYGATGRMCKDILNPEKTASEWKSADNCKVSLGGKDVAGVIVTNQVIDDSDKGTNSVCCMYPVGYKTSTTPVDGALSVGDECTPGVSVCPASSTCKFEINSNKNTCQSDSA